MPGNFGFKHGSNRLWECSMSLSRIAVSVASIFLGLFTVLVISVPKTSAQVIHACANNSSGEVKIVAAGVSCPANWTTLTWNVAGPPGPAGAALGAANFFCPTVSGNTVSDFPVYAANAPIPGPSFTAGVNFGAPINYDGTKFFLANAGTYLVHFSTDFVAATSGGATVSQVAMLINGVLGGRTWRGTTAGDVLIQVPVNTTVQFFNGSYNLIQPGSQLDMIMLDCSIIFTRLQ
jgi:hypothetical protein